MKITRLLPRGYSFICVHDPLGLFYGGIFRLIDIKTCDLCAENGWANGTEWKHIHKPSIHLTYKNGQIIRSTAVIAD